MRIVKLVIAIVFALLRAFRDGLRRLWGRPVPSTFVVLMYHSVKSEECARFGRQMDRLLRAAVPVSAEFTEEEMKLGHTYVAVTFDDGYHSILENAIPVLLEKRIPVALFVPTRYLGSRPAWITDPASRDREDTVVSVDELKDLRRKGVVVGAHGVSHRPLAELDESEVFYELTESRRILEEVLEERISMIALPYGSASRNVLRFSKDAGYDRVFLGDPLVWRKNLDGHIAGRIGVSAADWDWEYRLKIRGAYQWLPVAIEAKRRLLQLLQWIPGVATKPPAGVLR